MLKPLEVAPVLSAPLIDLGSRTTEGRPLTALAFLSVRFSFGVPSPRRGYV
jgi:hypothetical protein